MKDLGNVSIKKSIEHNRLLRCLQTLNGILIGVAADGQLHDMEIKLLATWIAENREACAIWPASTLSRAIEDALEDNSISEAERSHLLELLQTYSSSNFWETGSVTPEVISIPIERNANFRIDGSCICHTGTFIYGTRSKCERLTTRAGGIPVSSVSKKTNLLVVGSLVTPSWAQESYGLKIMRAMELKNDGSEITIISEEQWFNHIGREHREV